MGRIQSSIGLITGTDIAGTVDKLMAISAKPRDRLVQRNKTLQEERKAINELTAQVIGLQLAGDQLAEPSLFRSKKASSSSPDVLSASVGKDAQAADHRVRTLQTAKTHIVHSAQRFAETDAALDLSGSLSIHPGGFIDGSASLAELNGGRGVDLGSIRITDRSGKSADIDLTSARNIDDVLEAINDAEIDVSATTQGKAIKLVDQTGATNSNLIVEQLGSAETAADLGIWGIDTASDTATGNELELPAGTPALRGAPLSELGGGSGIGPLTNLDLTLSDGTTASVDVSTATTITEVVDRINAAGISVTARLNEARNGLQLRDVSGGSGTFEISSADTTAEQLGIAASTDQDIVTGSNLHRQSVTRDTLLSELNQGQGVNGGSFTITDSNGDTGAINLTVEEITTVGGLIDAINDRSIGVTASLNETGDGIAVVDNAGGPKTMTIRDSGNATAAKDLGIAGTATDQTFGGSTVSALIGSEADTIDIAADDTLETIVEKINDEGRYGTASILANDDGTHSLVIRSNRGGEAGRLAINTDGLGLSLKTNSRGQDALIAMSTDGASERFLSSSDGVFEDEATGVNLTLKALSETPINVSVKDNPDAVVNSAKTFVKQYNKLVDKLDSLTFYDQEEQKVGLLFGSTEALRIETGYTRLLSGKLRNEGDIESLRGVGISFTDQGKLKLDSAALKEAMAENPDDVETFFADEDTGLAHRLSDLADRIAGEGTSLLLNRSDTLGKQIQRNASRVESMNERLESERQRLLKQYYRMEEAIAKIQSNQSYINQIQSVSAPKAAKGS